MIPILGVLAGIVIMIVAAAINWLHPNKIARRAWSVGIIVLLVFALMSMSLSAGAGDKMTDLTERYNDLTLYSNTIMYCDNEYVRYDFYDKVVQYNEDYEDLMYASKSNWTNWFYHKEDIAAISPVDFALHGGNFYGEG